MKINRIPKKSLKRISIMVPALNEEGNIAKTISEIEQGLIEQVFDYEIFLIDDGSSDKTGSIANKLGKRNKKIKIIHHNIPKGMGFCYREGLKLAKFEYYMYIPGDDQFPKTALIKMLQQLGKSDIIIPHVTNMHIRPFARQGLSYTFTFLVNLLFGLQVSYYNGTVIHKTILLRGALPKTNGFAYQAEILVRLLKSGASFIEVGYEMVERQAGSTSAFKIKNIRSVFEAIALLFFEIQIRRKLPVSQDVKTFLRQTI